MIDRLAQAAQIELDQSNKDSKWTERDRIILEKSLKSGDYSKAFLLLKRAVLGGYSRRYLKNFISLSSKLILSKTSWWPQKFGGTPQNDDIVKKSFILGFTSIVIHSLHNLKHLRQCMEGLEKYTTEQYEIVFVGCNSPIEITKWLKKQAGAVRHYKYIEAKRDQSFVQVLNEGISESSGEFIVLLSSGVMVSEHWLADMLGCLQSAQNTGIIGPLADAASGLQRSSAINNKSRNEMISFHERNRHRRIYTKDLEGFCMLFRRKLLFDIGLFDEAFISDKYMFSDICFRAIIAGYKNVIAGDVLISNFGSSMSGNIKIFDEKWTGIAVDTPLGKKVCCF